MTVIAKSAPPYYVVGMDNNQSAVNRKTFVNFQLTKSWRINVNNNNTNNTKLRPQ